MDTAATDGPRGGIGVVFIRTRDNAGTLTESVSVVVD